MYDTLTTTAPERIWLQVSDDKYDSESEFPANHGGITWCQDPVVEAEVEYVRADIAAFGSANSNAFRWLAKRLIAADFEWGNDRETVIVIAMPKGCVISASLRECVERGMLAERFNKQDNTGERHEN